MCVSGTLKQHWASARVELQCHSQGAMTGGSRTAGEVPWAYATSTTAGDKAAIPASAPSGVSATSVRYSFSGLDHQFWEGALAVAFVCAGQAPAWIVAAAPQQRLRHTTLFSIRLQPA